VTPTKKHQPLSDQQISDLTKRGCQCDDWSAVEVAEGFQTSRVRNATFSGRVRLGANAGVIAIDAGLQKQCGIYNAHIHNCTIDDDTRIANIGQHLANYYIGPGVCIENVGTLETLPEATFGNGIEVEALNEGGGREVILFDMLDSQFAHLMCLHRYRPKFIDKLQAIAQAEAAKVGSYRGTIEAESRIANVGEIVDVRVGRCAAINGAARLTNGTVLSSEEAATTIGADVQAEDFIIAEGSVVTGGAMLSSTTSAKAVASTSSSPARVRCFLQIAKDYTAKRAACWRALIRSPITSPRC